MLPRIRKLITILLLVLSFSLGSDFSAAAAQSSTVHAVLFYSPTCPHCHLVITELLPPLYEQYGDQLQIVGVDTSTAGGSSLYQATIQRFQIPQERLGVPTLVIGETVLVGSGEIPEQFPGLIEHYLALGGVDWPDIPGLQEALAASHPKPTATAEVAPTATKEPQAEIAFPRPEPTLPQEVAPQDSPNAQASGIALTSSESASLRERLGRDPQGNALAILVLMGMLGSLAGSTKRLLGSNQPYVLSRPSIWIPILCLVGMVVAGYLAFVETTRTGAVCGPVGDCNTVQQSEYARLFGVLPIGVLGLVGYAVIAFAWLVARFGQPSRRDWPPWRSLLWPSSASLFPST